MENTGTGAILEAEQCSPHQLCRVLEFLFMESEEYDPGSGVILHLFPH